MFFLILNSSRKVVYLPVSVLCFLLFSCFTTSYFWSCNDYLCLDPPGFFVFLSGIMAIKVSVRATHILKAMRLRKKLNHTLKYKCLFRYVFLQHLSKTAFHTVNLSLEGLCRHTYLYCMIFRTGLSWTNGFVLNLNLGPLVETSATSQIVV